MWLWDYKRNPLFLCNEESGDLMERGRGKRQASGYQYQCMFSAGFSKYRGQLPNMLNEDRAESPEVRSRRKECVP